jgi:hypothetical protein
MRVKSSPFNGIRLGLMCQNGIQRQSDNFTERMTSTIGQLVNTLPHTKGLIYVIAKLDVYLRNKSSRS